MMKTSTRRRQIPFSLTGFPDSSVGKESACSAGEPGSIPVLGRSPGEGIGYPLQYQRVRHNWAFNNILYSLSIIYLIYSFIY